MILHVLRLFEALSTDVAMENGDIFVAFRMDAFVDKQIVLLCKRPRTNLAIIGFNDCSAFSPCCEAAPGLARVWIDRKHFCRKRES